ncbi:MAG: septation protein IspZ [Halobacteriovoraceae bacterium]|nr:septation protein IspZ [Halobacteriovoraceae bacterium]MCB9095331.1 septation protein IspZ [Halobacteriovoraceae bacterium]
MSNYSFLYVIIPLLVFVIVDSFASLNTALITTIIAAIGECAFSYYSIGELDSFSVFSIFLVILLAGLSFSKKSRKIFYFKPAILSLGLGFFLIITYMLDQFVLYDGMMKYGRLLSEPTWSMMQNERFQHVLKMASLTVGIASLFHGLVSIFAALKFNRWWWFVVAGLGSYFFLFLGILAASLI